MSTADPYDVQGLLRAVARVKPELRQVLRVSREAHSHRKLRKPLTRPPQRRCERGHFARRTGCECGSPLRSA